MTKDYEDKVAVITGAASGIGYALAEKCLNEGMNAQVGFIGIFFTNKNRQKEIIDDPRDILVDTKVEDTMRFYEASNTIAPNTYK